MIFDPSSPLRTFLPGSVIGDRDWLCAGRPLASPVEAGKSHSKGTVESSVVDQSAETLADVKAVTLIGKLADSGQ